MLNKKVLRQFAADNPAPAIPANHGLLHAQQVDYIIRTDVKIIDRRRTLILYVYKQTGRCRRFCARLDHVPDGQRLHHAGPEGH